MTTKISKAVTEVVKAEYAAEKSESFPAVSHANFLVPITSPGILAPTGELHMGTKYIGLRMVWTGAGLALRYKGRQLFIPSSNVASMTYA